LETVVRENSALSPPKHRTAQAAQRIDTLTTVAAELFLERGFESVAGGDLIARVGGSRRNVYSHFGGKEGLFIEAMTRLCAELALPLEQLVIDAREPRKALSTFGHQLLQSVLEPRTLALHRLMVAEGKHFPELAQAMLKAGHDKAVDTLTAWIERRQAQSGPVLASVLPARALAALFVSMVTTEAQLRALVGLDAVPFSPAQITRIVDNAVHVFLDGATQRRSSHVD